MLNKFLDKLPSGPVIFFGGIYFFMPILPEPHLLEKFFMLRDGVELLPIDWLDIVLHSSGGAFAVLKWRRDRQLQAQGLVAEGNQDSVPVDKPEHTDNKD
ncbi:RND transporter [Pseudomonadota bacterium]